MLMPCSSTEAWVLPSRPDQGMAGLGAIAVQILRLAAAPKPYLDGRLVDVKGVVKSVFLHQPSTLY
jgi:hypothetical protein